MSKSNTHAAQKLAVAGVLTAAAVVGSFLSVPVAEANVLRYSIWSMYSLPSFSDRGGGSALHSVQA